MTGISTMVIICMGGSIKKSKSLNNNIDGDDYKSQGRFLQEKSAKLCINQLKSNQEDYAIKWGTWIGLRNFLNIVAGKVYISCVHL